MYLFTSEVVSPGHPDKCADIIADSIVDKILSQDPNGRVASEVFVAGKNIVIGGEINSKVSLNQQSPDINQGVDQTSGEIGAGDQGIMFGFASYEAKEFMPAAITYARMLCNKVYKFAKANPDKLGVDIKTQVTIDYGTKDNFENCKPQSIHTIVVSAPCVESMKIEELRALVQELIDETGLPEKLYNKEKTIIYINPTGRYVNHSSLHDSGLTGRKLIVDSFGGYAPIGGGAQSSKDYTKVDRSGLYAARYIAKNIVAAGLAKKCIVQLSYAIGVAKPTSVSVDTMGTQVSGLNDDILSDFVMRNFPLTPKWITQKFGLDKPGKESFLYAKVAAKGQVGNAKYPWEKLDAVDTFKALIK